MLRMTREERRQKQREFDAVLARKNAFGVQLQGLRRQLRIKSIVPGCPVGAARLAEIGILQKRFIAVQAEFDAAWARVSRLAGELVA